MNKDDEENFDVYLQMQEQKLAEYEKALSKHMATDSVNDQSAYSNQDLQKYNYRMAEYESNEQDIRIRKEEKRGIYKKRIILTTLFALTVLVLIGVFYFGKS